MRFTAALLSLTALACTPAHADHKFAPAPKTAPDPVAHRKRMCEIGLRAVDGAASCKLPGPQYTFELALEQLVLWRDTRVEGADRHYAGSCAMRTVAYALAAADAKCALTTITRAERDEATTFLATWFAERASPRATGDTATDTYLRSLAGIRDRVCACKPKDSKCLDADRLVDTLVLPGKATPKASEILTDDMSALILDISKCRNILAADLLTPAKP